MKRPRDLYARSKSSAERLARDLQAEGAPVVISYPGWVIGPDDPTVNDGVRLIFECLNAGAFPVLSGGVSTVDVRDLAAAHAAAMKPGLGPRRYVLGGHFLTFPELVGAYMRVTGRRVWKVPTTGLADARPRPPRRRPAPPRRRRRRAHVRIDADRHARRAVRQLAGDRGARHRVPTPPTIHSATCCCGCTGGVSRNAVISARCSTRRREPRRHRGKQCPRAPPAGFCGSDWSWRFPCPSCFSAPASCRRRGC